MANKEKIKLLTEEECEKLDLYELCLYLEKLNQLSEEE